jgi:hypothetical protein
MRSRLTRPILTSAVTFLLAILPFDQPALAAPRREPRNFVFFELERERITEASFLETTSIVGAQLKYTWRELEPERDRYDLEPLRHDLAFLDKHGKRLFVQLQDVSFDPRIVLVPDYLRKDPAFTGGVAEKNPTSGKKVTVEELYRFAADTLRLDYVFWGTEEPYYSKEVLPFVRTLSSRRVEQR